MTDWQNRIVSYGVKPASQFTPHPSNPKFHPKAQQDALKGALDTVGWVDTVKESLHSGYLLDGHERIWQALAQGDETPVPYIVLDVTEDEELFILATLDPIGQMAQHDAERTRALLEQVNSDNAAIQAMLSNLAQDTGIIPPDFDPVNIDEQPRLDQKKSITCPHCGQEFTPA